MKIRRARPDDAAGIETLYVQLREHHARFAPSDPRDAMSAEDWSAYARGELTRADKRFYVAVVADMVVGFLELFFEQRSWGLACEVETLVVDEKTRGSGVGLALMRRAEEVAREEGALGMRVNVLPTNSDGRRFYESDGYRTIAVRYGKSL